MKSSLLLQVKHSTYYPLLLAILSGLLLGLGWPMSPLTGLLFVGWIPILMLEKHVALLPGKRKGRVFMQYAYLAMLIWNIITTWWVCNATVAGGIFAIIANAGFMTIPLTLFRFTKQYTNQVVGYISFIVFWLCFEYVHLNWDLSWSWLTLGNGMALAYRWVQWYEYTGVLGGSLWLLLVNLLLFLGFFKKEQIIKPIFAWALVVLILPLVCSWIAYTIYKEAGQDTEIVVVQPNIDPYSQKFEGSEAYIPVEEQVKRFIKLSETKISPKTSWVLWPETAIDATLPEQGLEQQPVVELVRQFVSAYPQISLITGATSYSLYPNKEAASATSRFRADVGYYDVFNTALYFKSGQPVSFYHKSKLVPGVEQMPYPKFFGLMSSFVIDLGGISGGLGKQAERQVFGNPLPTMAPVICYESIYGDFVTGYMRKGARLIGVITNDGWWGNTPGHKQHLAYASLRAIENRKSVARSANTGISGYINQKGDLLQKTKYWEQDVLVGTIKANDKLTFYASYGDYIGTLAGYLTVVLLIWGGLRKWVLGRKTNLVSRQLS